MKRPIRREAIIDAIVPIEETNPCHLFSPKLKSSINKVTDSPSHFKKQHHNFSHNQSPKKYNKATSVGHVESRWQCSSNNVLDKMPHCSPRAVHEILEEAIQNLDLRDDEESEEYTEEVMT